MWRSVLEELWRFWEDIFLRIAILTLNRLFVYLLYVVYALIVYFCIFFL